MSILLFYQSRHCVPLLLMPYLRLHYLLMNILFQLRLNPLNLSIEENMFSCLTELRLIDEKTKGTGQQNGNL